MKKYERIQHFLTEEIEKGTYHPGDRLPSEHELCRIGNVSRNVVRQALRNLEARGITETVKGVGTFCRSLPLGRPLTSTIGFIGFFSHSYIFPDIIAGSDAVLYPRNFHLLVGQSLYTLERERNLLVRFQQRGVDGIIMEPIYDGTSGHSNASLIRSIIESGIPVVFIDNAIPDIEATAITLNDLEAGEQAAAYLYERGHRRIALFFQEDYLVKIRRRQGFEEYCRRMVGSGTRITLFPFRGQGAASTAGKTAKTLIDSFIASRTSEPADTAGNDAGAWQISRETRTEAGSFSAVFCSSDEDAMHIIDEADRRGVRIPQDLSIVGFDNQQTSGMNRISLTTFEHPSMQLGRMAAGALLELILHPKVTVRTVTTLNAKLVERDSVRSLTPDEMSSGI